MIRRLQSNVMPALRIDGSSVHFNYWNHPWDLYEIRGVSSRHLVDLASTQGHDVWSTSASVQRLALMYPHAHYANGELAEPQPAKTTGLTPWG